MQTVIIRVSSTKLTSDELLQVIAKESQHFIYYKRWFELKEQTDLKHFLLKRDTYTIRFVVY